MELSLVNKFDSECDDLLDIIDDLVIYYTKPLDDYIEIIRKDLRNCDAMTNDTLANHIATLPVLIYNLTDKLQYFGIKQDAAKMQRRTVYNNAYQNTENGTVAQKTTIAQEACTDEQMIEDIFTRAYKTCESKLEIADMLHSSLKKVLQLRMTELEVTRNNMLSGGM